MIVATAYGGNSVAVPCLWFESWGQATEYLEKAGLWLDHARIPKVQIKLPASMDHSKLFTRYYNGCGEAYLLELTEVSSATPFVGWDLD